MVDLCTSNSNMVHHPISSDFQFIRQWLMVQDGDASDPEKEAKSARTLTGRCWMAEGFPMSLRQLLPILDIVGTANKHLARVAKFMQKYGDMELFPVKLQVLTQALSCLCRDVLHTLQPGIRILLAHDLCHISHRCAVSAA